MKGVIHGRGLYLLGSLLALVFTTIPAHANPFTVDAAPTFQFGTISSILIAILVEACCVLLLLRGRRTPRFFIFWLLGMHLFTYPAFLGWLWLCLGTHPALAITTGEGLVVLIEGSLIYLMCRFAPSAKSVLPLPSVGKTMFASLIGNIASMVAFPLLTMLNVWLAYALHSSGVD